MAGRTLAIDGEFGSVRSVAVDRAGRIYVADGTSQEIRVFAPDGDPLRTVGRRGRGPGEYTHLQDVVVARGDSLFALDIALQRVSVYSLGRSPALAYTINVPARLGKGAGYSLLVPAGGGVVVQYAPAINAGSLDARREIVLRRLDRRGSVVADSILVVPDRELLVTRDPQYGYSVGLLPFGRRPLLRMGADDRLYYGWSDSLAVGVYSLDGARVGRIGAPHPAPRVTDDDLRTLLGSYQTELGRSLLRKALDEGKVPSTKPAFKDFLVDDRGRVWINVVTGEDVQVSGDDGLRYAAMPGRDDRGSPWWVFDRAGKRVAALALPRNVTLHVVRGTDAYGVETDDLGVQRIVRYRVRA
ncbi:MAG TPA: 6-bladed beta-propeller [Longimicrobiaceae bacterium]